MGKERGMSALDLLVTVALLGIVAAMVAPNFRTVRRQGDMERLARQVRQAVLDCRIQAITGGRNVGLVFTQGTGGWYYLVAEDWDGDGVSRRGLERGVDRALGPKVWLKFLCSDAGVGVPAGWRVPDPSGSGWLPPGDGLRIGSAKIVSFSPTLGATPSTLYFHDATSRMVAVRIHGGMGRIRVLEWRQGWTQWREMPL